MSRVVCRRIPALSSESVKNSSTGNMSRRQTRKLEGRKPSVAASSLCQMCESTSSAKITNQDPRCAYRSHQIYAIISAKAAIGSATGNHCGAVLSPPRKVGKPKSVPPSKKEVLGGVHHGVERRRSQHARR